MKRLIVCNDGLGSPNKGDQAILQAMLDDFNEFIPQVSVEVIPYSGIRTIKKFFRILSRIRKSDLFVLGGGHPFQDQTSQVFLFFGLLLILLARLMRKKVACYAVGAGPIDSPWGKKLTGWILNKASLISVREQVSKAILIDTGVKEKNIVVTADAAFSLQSIKANQAKTLLNSEGIEKRGPQIGFCLRRWFCFQPGFWPQQYRRGRKKKAIEPGRESVAAKAILKEFCNHLIEQYQATIVFIPMRKSETGKDFGQDDDLYSREIMEMVEKKQHISLLKGDYSPVELKGIFSIMDMVISVRMHPLILAASSGVPVMGIPFSRSKGEGFFNLIDQPGHFVYIDEMDLTTLIRIFDSVWSRRSEIRVDLTEKSGFLKQKARENIQMIRSMLGVTT